MLSICNTYGVSVAAAGQLAARHNRLIYVAAATLEQAAEAVIKVMGNKKAAW